MVHKAGARGRAAGSSGAVQEIDVSQRSTAHGGYAVRMRRDEDFDAPALMLVVIPVLYCVVGRLRRGA